MKFQAQFVPNDPYWNLQWGPQIIEADYAWNTTTGDSSILVAVIDTGIDYDHPDLEGNYVALGYDWVNDDAYPLDDNGHGTHCAGIIAAVLNNTVGIAGIANVSIMAEKGLDANGSGWEDDLANAIIHAVNQSANILSNSWGDYGESFLIHDAVQYAYNHGVLVIGAAGNEAISGKLYPAAYNEVVAVTATDSYDSPAWFTNFGDWVEVAAPGVDIYSTMPTYYVTMNDYGYSMNYSYMSGTSMACPHFAGVAALIWSQFPNATRDWVRAQLRYTGNDLGDPGFDKYYSYGRINAKNAVEQAPPEHDLLIFDWERPPYVKLGELAIFNITVLNFGVSNETDVEVHLLVNGSSIDSTSIALLPRGVSTTVGLSWTPTTRGTYNVTYYVAPVADEKIIQNNLIAEIVTVIAPPPETNWILLATDPDEGVGINLKSIYGQTYSDIIYFKVEYHRPWTTINDIDTAILIDADQDAGTGLSDGTYPGQDTGIGADYLIVVGWEATEMWKWDPVAGMWDIRDPISLAYLEAPENSNAFVVGVFFANVETAGIIDSAVADVPSNWDWVPDSGYFTWILIIPISVNPSTGSPGTKVTVTGTKATANGTVSIYWDSTFMGNSTANEVGDFTYLMTVPSEATVGVHEMMATDVATGRTGSTIFRVILTALNPTEGSIGTNVTVNGAGFAPESQVTVTFGDMLIGYAIIDSFGNFTFTFNTPLSTAGKYYIKALDAEGNYACKKFTVVDVTPLDVQIDVGTMHFKGEIAEFYAQTTFKGQAVSAIISSAILYKPDGTVENLLAQDVTIGLYKIPYAIPGDAEPGTYTLVITAHYVTDKVQAVGTSFKCFVISSTLTNMNMTIQELQGDIATIIIPDLGMIKAKLTAINATVVKIKGSLAVVNSTLGLIQATLDTIQLKVIAINGTMATIQTTLGIMNGTITSIEGNMATIEIETDIGTIKADISGMQGTQDAWIISQYVIIVIALIAVASSMLSVIFLRHKKTAKTE